MKISQINNYQFNNNNNINKSPILNQKRNSDTLANVPYRESASDKQTSRTVSFGLIKPEFMYIDTKGFAKDKDWAKTVVNIIDCGKQLIQKNTKFDDLIEYVTNRYNAYYKSFGRFFGNEFFGAKRFAITGNRLCDKYEPYNDRAVELVKKNTKDNNYRMCAYLPSQNEVVELTSVRYEKLSNGKYTSFVEAPDIKVIDPVMDEVGAIYKSLEDEQDFDKITNSVAKIHWLISQARPYTRGSAGVADMLSKMIFEAKGIQVSAYKKDVNPNIEAFVMPIEEYCEKYPSFFSEPLKKMQNMTKAV